MTPAQQQLLAFGVTDTGDVGDDMRNEGISAAPPSTVVNVPQTGHSTLSLLLWAGLALGVGVVIGGVKQHSNTRRRHRDALSGAYGARSRAAAESYEKEFGSYL